MSTQSTHGLFFIGLAVFRLGRQFLPRQKDAGSCERSQTKSTMDLAHPTQQITTTQVSTQVIAQFEIPMSPTYPHHFWRVIENFILLHVILLFLNIDVYTHRQCRKEMSIVSTKFIVKFCFEFLLGKAPGGQSSQPATW